jgi:hypothetical protein
MNRREFIALSTAVEALENTAGAVGVEVIV